ncbi:adenosylcobinamide-phosphate synthase CbiB [Novosphingobium sp. KCTC 2891]|uniref:adenosylcobinamide-phosphate synthase CbiB n=1 Tax=Novosphingobium sp. KCTC 2891 TaxID=2989730 RepID=UPI002221E8B6|nr:adenosylcobinamide-phosphate synthase CbiB [Novosphingobium sp. KCTC 2891]MCW1383728.1 adenosylcobinamide-phosphate synthase CbiB [Novosphingobium sp. KCTC 2891]
MAEPVALAALALDAALGWPARVHARIGHPVGAFARFIAVCERRWNRNDASAAVRKAGGVATIVSLIALTGLGGALLTLTARQAGPAGWLVTALLAWPALAQRSLDQHVAPVIEALQASDLDRARAAVGMIVGRDTAALDQAGVARAAIESLAESFCDGVIAPLFWLLVAGLPGVWIMKAVNTADSLIGHKDERYRDFGWAAARLDDLMNLVPARISAVLICIAGPGGWRIGWRYRRAHDSPNAGWPEAAMAGVLRVRLAGPACYDGDMMDKPWIGEGKAAGPEELVRARRVYRRACVLGWLIAGGMAWLG